MKLAEKLPKVKQEIEIEKCERFSCAVVHWDIEEDFSFYKRFISNIKTVGVQTAAWQGLLRRIRITS